MSGFRIKAIYRGTQAESALTDISDPNYQLKYPGDKIQMINNSNWTSRAAGTYLFGSQFDAYVRSGNDLFNPVVLTEIELPTGQKYKFSYNNHGLIEKITYPTGGEEKFVHNAVPPLTQGDAGNVTDQFNFGVTNRKVYVTAGTGTPYEWNYSAAYVAPSGYKVSVTSPDLTLSEKILYQGNPPCTGCTFGDFGYDNALAGMPYEERSYDSSNPRKLLSLKLTSWAKKTFSTYPVDAADWHPRITQEESRVYDSTGSGVSTTTTLEYEGDLNYRETPVLQKKSSQYAFVPAGSALPANPVRSSESTFLINDPNYAGVKSYYTNQNMVGLVTAAKIRDAAGTVVSQSELVYDESGYSPSYRGQPTTVRNWINTNNSWITTRAKYDAYGNVIETTDANANVSQIQYTDNFSDSINRNSNAFPTKTISAVPGGNGSTSPFETTVKYDFATGLAVSTTDINGQTSTIEYNDPLLRPTKIIAPNGHQTITEYGAGTSASTRFVKVRSQIDAANWKEGYSWFDGLGRTIKSQSVDNTGDVFVESQFDTVGRPWKTSNPYRLNETPVWTTNVYDEASRIKEIITPDGAKVQTAYSVATTGSNFGTVVTVTDQALKQRRSVTNALGQLTRVDEPTDAAGLGAINTPNQPTNYAYDTLSNLTTVSQGVQTRSFTYNSLSRLLSATNPESGLIQYAYDNNGNLTTKTDARNIVTTYAYDALNRVKTRSYNDGVTPAVSYFYDNLSNAKGKLTKVSSSVSTTEYTAFDILGRVTQSKQTTDGVTYGNGTTDSQMTYTYNLGGALTEQQYPSGRVVKNVLDPTGDLSVVQSKKNSTSGFFTYASAFSYTPAGAVSSLKLGNGKWESTQFNSRLQPTQIALGTVQNGTDKLKLNFDYGGSTTNNGNVQSQTITVPGMAYPLVQTYAYDSLNRLDDANETYNGAQSWRQDFTYDRYGNRNFVQANTTFPSFANPAVTNPAISTANNRITSTGWLYDAAGNTTRDGNYQTFTYDAENKQTEVKNSSSVSLGQYWYDGDGRRVKKYVPASGETTVFVYDAGGKTIAEYSSIVYTGTDAKVAYTTSDHLGSPRINTDANGVIIARHDYLPFGEELTPGMTAQRTSGTNYVGDTNRKQFTGYERDIESDLDFAQARYYNKNHGRFTSIDPLMASAVPGNPQSWNRYAYVLNNPLLLTDPTGMSPTDFINENGTRSRIDDGKDQVLTADSEQVSRLNELHISNSAAYAVALGSLETSGASLGLTRDQFTERVATVYGESSAWKMPAGDELSNEMKSFAYANQRNPAAAAYGAKSEQADIYRQTPHGNETDRMKLGNLAVVNQVRGGHDPSGGATNWDGRDQAVIPASETRRSVPASQYGGKSGTTWEVHKNTIGWKISDADYGKWKANVGSAFRAPQESRSANAGSYVSTAVWGHTIFWKKK